MKVDYAFVEYLRRTDLSIYYFDNTLGKLVSIKKNVNISDDGFIEFEIDHNSDFLIVNEKAPSNGGTNCGGNNWSNSGSSTSKKDKDASNTPKHNTIEAAIDNLSKIDKDTILNNFKENMPYTSINGILTV